MKDQQVSENIKTTSETDAQKRTSVPFKWYGLIHKAARDGISKELVIQYAAAWYHDHCLDLEHWNDDRAKMIDLKAELANIKNVGKWEALWRAICAILTREA